jgi:methylated-DNA-[protein]-cysteine S-methyltransferase
MTGEYRYTIIITAGGYVGILGSENGLKSTTLPQETGKDARDTVLAGGFSAKESDSLFPDLKQRIISYYNGNPVEFPDKLDFNGATSFQRSVWRAVAKISYGETRSYGWVAAQIGKPGASRAVGQALHRNPLPLIVPCHRVIGSDGKLVGFGGGIDLKKALLELEKQAG